MASRNTYRRAVNRFKATTGFNRLFTYGQGVHDAILANVATFATPAITMANFQTDLTALRVAMNLYGGKNTNRTSTTNLNIIKAAALVVFLDIRVLTDYVNTVATGDKSIVTLSGMAIDKGRAPIRALPQVQNARQMISKSVPSLHAKIKWKRPAGSKLLKGYTYLIEFSPGSAVLTFGQAGITTKTSFTMDLSLYQDKKVYFRITPVSPILNSSSTANSYAIGSPIVIGVSVQA